MDKHTLELTTDEVEAITELLDHYAGVDPNPHEHVGYELSRVRWKLGVIREEPRDPDVDARFKEPMETLKY